MRKAHIVTTPHEVGDRVLAICGKEHKVKQTWEDIPDEAPICRACVDIAIAALDQLDEVLNITRRRVVRTALAFESLADVVNPDDGFMVDAIAGEASVFQIQREQKKQQKEDRIAAQRTCSCEWIDGVRHSDSETNCPVHSEEDDFPPVAPEE